jgi:hypothetical protein
LRKSNFKLAGLKTWGELDTVDDRSREENEIVKKTKQTKKQEVIMHQKLLTFQKARNS